jgi:hypothetical protein
MINVWEAAAQADDRAVREVAESAIDRYGTGASTKRMTRLLEFLPLLPALEDSHHARHAEALEFWGKDPDWTVLRWIWIRRFKLSAEDGITLIGGRENERSRKALIGALEGKRDDIQDALNDLTAHLVSIGSVETLAFCEGLKVAKPAPFNEPDLKPKDAVLTREAVRAKLAASR